jgi:hypothetical protein
MTASAIMSLGVRAMFANYAGLQTSGHNIANAGVDGYSRQQVELQTAIGQFTGSGFIGKGVDVKTITRIYDQFLSREAMTAVASVHRCRPARSTAAAGGGVRRRRQWHRPIGGPRSTRWSTGQPAADMAARSVASGVLASWRRFSASSSRNSTTSSRA